MPHNMVNAGAVDHLRGKLPGFASGGAVGSVPGISSGGSKFGPNSPGAANPSGPAFGPLQGIVNKVIDSAKLLAAFTTGNKVAATNALEGSYRQGCRRGRWRTSHSSGGHPGQTDHRCSELSGTASYRESFCRVRKRRGHRKVSPNPSSEKSRTYGAEPRYLRPARIAQDSQAVFTGTFKYNPPSDI